MKYGLSLSECVRDMAKGFPNPNFVIAIYAGTNFDLDNPYEVDKIVLEYSSEGSVWSDEPSVCEDIFRSLVQQRKIRQPRRTMRKVPDIRDGHWVDSEEEIQWIRVLDEENGDVLTSED